MSVELLVVSSSLPLPLNARHLKLRPIYTARESTRTETRRCLMRRHATQ